MPGRKIKKTGYQPSTMRRRFGDLVDEAKRMADDGRLPVEVAMKVMRNAQDAFEALDDYILSRYK